MTGPDRSDTISTLVPSWGRSLAIITAVMFVISSVFPVAAGLVRTENLPRWWGILDVIVAFFLAFLAIAVSGLAQGKVDQEAVDTTYRAYRILIHGLIASLVVFFLLGDRIKWTNCLIGFAWRAWLLLYTLPAWFTMIRTAKPDQY